MTAQRFANSNIVMMAPRGMDNCCDVHAAIGQYENGQPYIITAWRPTPEELVKINLGEPVWLHIVSHRMPPVSVTMDNPFQDNIKQE
jgi:hypothetical protein